MKPYAALGSASYPKPDQVEKLNRATALPPPEVRSAVAGKLPLTLAPNALVLLHISR